MLASDVNFDRMCAISFSTRFSSASLLLQLRRSEMKTVRPRIAMAARRGRACARQRSLWSVGSAAELCAALRGLQFVSFCATALAASVVRPRSRSAAVAGHGPTAQALSRPVAASGRCVAGSRAWPAGGARPVPFFLRPPRRRKIPEGALTTGVTVLPWDG